MRTRVSTEGTSEDEDAAAEGVGRTRLSELGLRLWARLEDGLGELPVAKVRRDSAISSERKERRPTGMLLLREESEDVVGPGEGWRERGLAESQSSMRPLVKSEE